MNYKLYEYSMTKTSEICTIFLNIRGHLNNNQQCVIGNVLIKKNEYTINSQ